MRITRLLPLFGLLALGTALMLPAGCTRAPQRDAGTDEQARERFSTRRLERHRLVPPIQAPPDDAERTAADTAAVRLPGTPAGPVPEVYWVSELATPDAIAAVTRHDDLLGAGARGFQAILGWLEQAGDGAAVPPGSMLQVLRCANQMLDTPDRFAVNPESGGRLAARLAALVQRMTAGSDSSQTDWPLRCEALQLLARVYTAAEAPVLAAGLADPDSVTAAACANALTVHLTRVAAPTPNADGDADADADRDRSWTSSFESAADWPTIPASIAARLMTRPAAREVRLQGLMDPTSELRARTLSQASVWHEAIDRLAARSRAALRGATVVWSLLDHPALSVRSRAAHCLRLMTGEFAGYMPTSGPIQRQLQIARWASLLIRIVPAAGSDPLAGGIER